MNYARLGEHSLTYCFKGKNMIGSYWLAKILL